jgi:hypothetical protein
MKIETKFNLGDIVQDTDKPHRKGRISSIVMYETGEIVYGVVGSDLIYTIPESNAELIRASEF